jgi:predicted metallopeptidase
MNDSPHFLSDSTVNAVGTNEYISTVAGAVFCVHNHTIFTVLHMLDALVGLYPVFVLEAIVEDFENRLTIEEDLGIPNPKNALVSSIQIG